MSIKLGNTTASLYLGGTPVAAYLGAEQVYSAATVPGAPTINDAFFDSVDSSTFVSASGANNGAPVASVRFVFSVAGEQVPDGLNGLLIDNTNGNYSMSADWSSDYTGQTVQVFVTNSVGESEGSEPVEVTAS